jgi:glycosyltransferase involved in cell wall biosynthesis
MKILMCLGSPFPPDIRVEKEARALAQAGHKVFVLTPYKKGSPAEENIGYATLLRRIPQPTLPKRAWNLVSLSLFGIIPLWIPYIAEAVQRYGIEAIHVHDLPLVNTGLKVAKKNHLPLVADLHENYPDAVRFYHSSNWRGKISNMFISPKKWQVFETAWVNSSDRVITVVDEIGRHLVNDCGLPEDKLTIVMNTEDLDSFCSMPLKKDIIERYKSFFIISYIGGFARHRGIDTAILAMPKITSAIPEARLVLVGTGSNETALKELVQRKGLEKTVEFTGFQPFESVPSYMTASQVCLIPYIDSIQTNRSAPHKLFQYMALGKPVVVSSMESLSRIMEETGAGLVYTAGDADALAEAVIRLYKDKPLANKLGKAGLAAVKTRYNWEIEGKKLVEMYRSLKVG